MIAASATASGQAATPAVDLTGKWAITIGTPGNEERRSLEAVMARDGTLTGSLGSPNGAVPIRSGRVDGTRFTLSAMLGTGLPVSYQGVVSGDTIRGTWRYDKIEGVFVGRRGDVAPSAEAVAPRAEDAAIDKSGRDAAIDAMMREIRDRYVDTALAPRVTTAIRDLAAAGAYDTLSTRQAFARAVTQDLRRYDKHFSMFPATPTGQPQIPAGSRDNYGIKRVERLDGNVGYLRFDVFSLDSAGAGSVLRSALRFLGRTDALILDLRQNRGGNGQLVQLLLSYLIPGPSRVTTDIFIRTPTGFDSSAMSTATRIESDLQYGDRPLYVLTSSFTASAAEWLAYDLQARGRAKIVGDVTAGAAHPVRFVRLNNMFDASIPIGRSRSRVTHGDFEGVGVQPDMKVASSDALDVAYGAAVRTLLSQTTNALAKAELERAANGIKPRGSSQ
jgi:hypothetical protein